MVRQDGSRPDSHRDSDENRYVLDSPNKLARARLQPSTNQTKAGDVACEEVYKEIPKRLQEKLSRGPAVAVLVQGSVTRERAFAMLDSRVRLAAFTNGTPISVGSGGRKFIRYFQCTCGYRQDMYVVTVCEFVCYIFK